jgi:cis-3-alkyl-4-acyloxetan-2-one decarboxylase
MITSPRVDRSTFSHLYPFRSRYLELDRLRYHYVDEGSGEPIVMVHGNPTWSFFFRRLIKGLSDKYRTIVPDHIGCGLSDRPDDADYDFTLESRVNDFGLFTDALGLTHDVTLIVHDWGGAIGLAWAVRHLERVRRLVVLNTAAFFPPGGQGIPWRLKIIRNFGRLGSCLVQGCNAFALGAVYMASVKPLAKDVRAGLLAPYNSRHNRLATLRFVEDIPLKPSDRSYDVIRELDDHLDRLRGKAVLICWGMKDFVFTMDYYEEWRRRFPDAETHAFEDAGHYLLEDKPDEILTIIEAFLKKHPIID